MTLSCIGWNVPECTCIREEHEEKSGQKIIDVSIEIDCSYAMVDAAKLKGGLSELLKLKTANDMEKVLKDLT